MSSVFRAKKYGVFGHETEFWHEIRSFLTEKRILLQQKPRSAKSMPVKMWQIVPELGLVAIFGPILATEPRSGTDRPPQECV